MSRPISIAWGNLTMPRLIPETICPTSETIYFHLRRPVVKPLGGKNWPSSINLTFPRHDREIRMAVLHVVGCRYITECLFLGRLGESLNESCLVTPLVAFDELPFIELSLPHETVISQWNYRSSLSRNPVELKPCEFCFSILLLRIYVTSTYRPSPCAIITVIMPVTVTMIVIVVIVLATIKVLITNIHRLGWYALGFSRYTLELLSSGGNILFRAEIEYFSSKILFK